MEATHIEYTKLHGKMVEVFSDPITRQDREGEATIRSTARVDSVVDGDVYVRAMVRFIGDGANVSRVFRVKDVR